MSSCRCQGNIADLMSLTGWSADRVLYIGDHVYTDLAVSVCVDVAYLAFQ